MKLNKKISKFLVLCMLTSNLYFNSNANSDIPNRYETLEGEYITINDSTEGNLEEIEIFGNTVQNENNLEDIQSVGDLYVDENGKPILDSQGREQYKIDIVNNNKNLNSINWHEVRNNDAPPTLGNFYGTTLKLRPNTTYYITISNDTNQNLVDDGIYSNLVTDYQDIIWVSHPQNNINGNSSRAVKTGDLGEIYFKSGSIDENWLEKLNKIKIQIELGSNKTNYTLHQGDKVTILLPTQLQKVGNTMDRLYWDNEEGRYLIEKKVNKVILDNNSKLEKESTSYFYTLENIGGKTTGWNTPFNFLTSHFKAVNGAVDTSSSNVSCLWRNRVYFRVAEQYPTIEDFKIFLQDNPISVYYNVDNPIIIKTNITSKLKIPTYEGKTYIFVDTKNEASPTLKVTVDKLPRIAKNAIEEAENDSTSSNISLARMYVNMLPESLYKDQLQEQLSQVFSSDITLDRESASSNLDVYVKSENMLSISLDTNSVTFEGYSGTEPMEKLNAVNLTINSSLPYDLNAYMPTEITNADGSSTIDFDILNIKESSESTYQQFADTINKVVLKSDCAKGNGNIHNIDLKLDSNAAHKADVYKTVIKFEAEQK